MDTEHRMVPTNSIRLHVVYAGPEDGKLVILLHGFPEFWWGWSKQIEPLADQGYRVVIPDQRGYNLSDKPLGVSSYHLDTLARDILGLIASAGRERAILVGHDWGAAVAWHLASYHPESVDKLAVLNVPHPAVMVRWLRSSFNQLRKSWYIFFFQIPWLPEWLLGLRDARGASELLLRSGKPNTFSEEDLQRYRQAWTQPGALSAMINWYRAAFRDGISGPTGFSSPLPRVEVPTLLLWGEQDVALSKEMAQPSINLCREGELVFFEDATHWLQHDEPAAVTRQLLIFFDGA